MPSDGALKLDQGELADRLADWAHFLESQHALTRYNAPRRFADGAAQAQPDQGQPLCVMFYTDRLLALVVGNVIAGDAWHGLGRFSSKLPRLDSLFIGQGCIVTDGSDEAVGAVVAHLAQLLQKKCLQRVEMKNLAIESALHQALDKPTALGLRALRVSHVRYLRRLRDPDTGAAVAYGTSKSRRKRRLRQRSLERAFDGTLEFSVITSPEQTDVFIKESAEIVSQTYQAALNVGISDDPATHTYLRSLAAEGSLRGYAFRTTDGAIAYAVGDLMCGTYYLWATSYLPAYAKLSPGILLLNQVFDTLTEEGVTLFDFGHGDAEYKRRLGNEERQEADLYVYGPQLVSRIAFAAHSGSEKQRTFVRNSLIRFGLLDRLRNHWRSLLKWAGAR